MIKRAIAKIRREALPYVTFDKKSKFKKLPFDFASYDTVIIFETSFGWDSIMRQRPQQLAASFPDDCLVIYHSAKDKYDDKSYYKRYGSVHITNCDIYREYIIDTCKSYENRYVVFYSTDPVPKAKISLYEKAGFTVVYEYVDDVNPALCSKRVYNKLKSNFEHFTSCATKTVCTATRLYDNASKLTDAALITNACDYEHFKATGREIPSDMVFEGERPIVGYYGALAEWFDYELIRKIAESGKYEIVLLGLSYDGSLERSGILDLEHVHYLGKKDYDTLPSYASAFDVCMIPFIKNELTASTSPVKLFEYMAAEKPIVTTDLDECRKYASVSVAKNHDEFSALLEKAVQTKDEPSVLKQLREDALNNTWYSKCRDILTFLRKA